MDEPRRKPEFAEKIADLKSHVPDNFARYEGASIDWLTKLKWIPLNDKQAPVSKPDGPKFDVHFTNKSVKPVKVFWMNCQGAPKPYGTPGNWLEQTPTNPHRSGLDDRRSR